MERGKEGLRAFYRDVFIPSWPDDLVQTPLNRVVGDGRSCRPDPHLGSPTIGRWSRSSPACRRRHKTVDIDIIVVVQFRGDKIACERIYWDQATVLRQVGLLAD